MPRSTIFLKNPITFSQDLSSAALSYSTTLTRPFKLEEITIHASVAITETITITKDSVSGAAYDVVLRTRDLSSEQSFVFRPEGDKGLFNAGDKIKIECTEANGTGVVSGEIKLSSGA